MRRTILILAALLFLITGASVIATGLKIKVVLAGTRIQIDPAYIDGKFYRKPIHAGFITQRLPVFEGRVIKVKGHLSKGLPTAREYRKH